MKSTVQNRAYAEFPVDRFDGTCSRSVRDVLAVEEPLEIRLVYGERSRREAKSISVTMRTPGHDAELAAGFLLTEGVIRDGTEIARIHSSREDASTRTNDDAAAQTVHAGGEAANYVTVELEPEVEVALATLERNFYTTSSCGVCGKASLLALRAVCPPRIESSFAMRASTLYELPHGLRESQGVFDRTGGLHAAALFNGEGELDLLREDVGRHNAVDKLIGTALLADRIPLRDRMLMLSGRASFELVQKAVMGGIAMIAAVGAPSSFAVQVAKEFDVTLVGFLREDHFNVYHGAGRVLGAAE